MATEFPWKQGLREYYMQHFPSDELGPMLDPQPTFEDLFNCLDRHQDVYGLIGAGDSLVRERLFSALSEIFDIPYDIIYDQWLQA